jgi:hypothetical protein
MQQQRAAANHSFFRANRPGNLNILDISDATGGGGSSNNAMPGIMSANAILTTNNSYINSDYGGQTQQQQQVQQQHQQPCSAGYMTGNVSHMNGLNSPHFQPPLPQQQQQQQQHIQMHNPVKQHHMNMVPMSPSYSSSSSNSSTSNSSLTVIVQQQQQSVSNNNNDGFQHPQPVSSLPPPQSPAMQPLYSPSYKTTAAPVVSQQTQYSHPTTPLGIQEKKKTKNEHD